MGFAARGLWVTRSVLAAVASVAGSFCAVAKLSAGVVLVFVKKKNVLVEVERGDLRTSRFLYFWLPSIEFNLSGQSKDRNFWVASRDR